MTYSLRVLRALQALLALNSMTRLTYDCYAKVRGQMTQGGLQANVTHCIPFSIEDKQILLKKFSLHLTLCVRLALINLLHTPKIRKAISVVVQT